MERGTHTSGGAMVRQCGRGQNFFFTSKENFPNMLFLPYWREKSKLLAYSKCVCVCVSARSIQHGSDCNHKPDWLPIPQVINTCLDPPWDEFFISLHPIIYRVGIGFSEKRRYVQEAKGKNCGSIVGSVGIIEERDHITPILFPSLWKYAMHT